MNCFELFAGCGGLGYGFHKEGFNIVVANIIVAALTGVKANAAKIEALPVNLG